MITTMTNYKNLLTMAEDLRTGNKKKFLCDGGCMENDDGSIMAFAVRHTSGDVLVYDGLFWITEELKVAPEENPILEQLNKELRDANSEVVKNLKTFLM